MKAGRRAPLPELTRVEITLYKTYQYIKRAYLDYVDKAKSDIVPLVTYGDIRILDDRVADLSRTLKQLAPALWKHETEAMGRRLALAKASLGIGFKPPPAEVLDEMLSNLLDNIQELTDDERDRVLEILSNAVAVGQSPIKTARELSDVIGLTSYQEGVVDSYRALLENNSSQALTRALRDRRYDGTVQNAIDANDFLDQDQIDMMVERYRERMIDMRAETIARTEGLKVTEQVRADSMDAMADQAGIDRGLVVKQWSATNDNRTRDTHAALDGQARLVEDPFDSESGAQLDHPGDGSAPPEEVINCRCTTAYHVFSDQEEVDAFLAENGQGKYDEA
jgi:F like protein